MNVSSFLATITSLSVPGLGLNWIDIFVLVILFFYCVEGFALGVLVAAIDFLSFALSFLVGITFYGRIATLLIKFLPISHGFANAIGFFVVAVLVEIIVNLILKILIANVSLFRFLIPSVGPVKIVSKLLGIIPGFCSGLLLSAFILSLIIALPFSLFLKQSILNAKIGSVLVANTQGFNKDWNDIFGGAVNDTLSFLTIEPQSNEIINLNFKTTAISIDKSAEQQMLQMVNSERTARKIAALSFSQSLTDVGTAHCEDMFKNGYFSHNSQNGLSPFDRMAQANIAFNFAGENLALAPSVDLAMKGLMQSPGHKANILSTDFHKVGIGVVNGGIYGEMFCQEFTD
ncbi:MAG: CvpA family protein [Candidatus Levyibacteriota bacterium]|jgi:uncharacterized protein YkwD